jgi:MFS family permease
MLYLQGGIIDMHQEIENLYNKVHQLEMNDWIHNDLFSFQWWIILIANAIFFVIFLFFIDRKRIFQMALAYMICFLVVCVSDDIGEYFGLWSYPHRFIPFITEFDVVEFAVVPVTITLMYQMFKSWKKYLTAGIIISFIFAFITLPLFVYLNITQLNNWKYFNSFLVLIVIFILVKCITDFITRRYHQLKQHEHDDRKFTSSFFQSKKKAR